MQRYVNIDMLALKQSDLSINEWILLSNIRFLSNNEYRACYASKESLRDYLGISKGQIFSILNNLEAKGFIVRTELSHLRVTKLYEDLVNFDNLYDSPKIGHTVQKLDTHSPKIGHDTVQKLDTKYRDIKKDIKKDSILTPLNDNISLDTNVKKRDFSYHGDLLLAYNKKAKMCLAVFANDVLKMISDILNQGFTKENLLDYQNWYIENNSTGTYKAPFWCYKNFERDYPVAHSEGFKKQTKIKKSGSNENYLETLHKGMNK